MNTRDDPRRSDTVGAGGLPTGGVVAAVDPRAATLAVLLVARHLATCLGTATRAVHVEEDPAGRRAVEDAAARAGVPVTVLDGDPAQVLASVLARPDVEVLVVGARGLPGSRDPLGHLTRWLLRVAAPTPVVVVPPSHVVPDRTLHRILTPFDTDPHSAAAVQPILSRLRAGGCQVVGLHVFEAATTPSFLDHGGYGMATWRAEFARRHGLADVELRRGAPGRSILDAAREQDVDLVVLEFNGVLDDHHGRVVGDVLAGAEVPVMLVSTALP